MHTLRISHDWAARIQAVRDAVTEDTNLIRFDNAFYRVCRGGEARFELQVLSVDGRAAVRMALRERDLYVLHLNGRPIEQYAKTLDRLPAMPMALDHAVHRLASAHGAGTDWFELSSLLVFCVAESLRNDHIATLVGQVIRTSTTGLLGAPNALPLKDLRTEVHLWGQACEAIFAALSPAARDIVLRPRVSLTPLQRRFSERVDLTRIEARLQPFARQLKVLKRPG